MKFLRTGWLLLLILGVSAFLRWQHLDWGTSNYDFRNPADSSGVNFYHFHPDEKKNVEVAGNMRESWMPTADLYGSKVAYSLYGASTVYINYFSVVIADLFLDFKPFVFDNSPDERMTFLIVRFMNSLMGILTVLFVYLIGARLFNRRTGLLASAFLAVTMFHVQISHYGIVDVPMVFFSVVTFYFIVRIQNLRARKEYLLMGLFFGIALSTKINSAVLVVPFLVAHLQARLRLDKQKSLPQKILEILRVTFSVDSLLAGGVTLLVFFILNPYAILDYQTYLFADNAFGFFWNLRNVGGEVLLPYQIQFMDNTFPLGMLLGNVLHYTLGWPLMAVSYAATLFLLWKGRRDEWLVLAWLLVSLLLLANAKVMFSRYALPLIPILMLLSGRAVDWLLMYSRKLWQRGLLHGVWILTVLFGLIYSLAYNRVYAHDSRLDAARWLELQYADSDVILHERSANTMKFYLDRLNMNMFNLNINSLMYDPNITLQGRVDFLYDKLLPVDWFIFVDTNRMAAYEMIRSHYPVESDFYRLLLNGELGFDVVYDEETIPSFMGCEFSDHEAEYSLRYYDHSRTIVMKKNEQFSRELFERWMLQYRSAGDQRENALQGTLRAMQQSDWAKAYQQITPLLKSRRFGAYALRLYALILEELNQPEQAQPVWNQLLHADSKTTVSTVLTWTRYSIRNQGAAATREQLESLLQEFRQQKRIEIAQIDFLNRETAAMIDAATGKVTE